MIETTDIKRMIGSIETGLIYVGAFGSYSELRRKAERKTGALAAVGNGRMYFYSGRWNLLKTPAVPKIMFSERYGLQQAVLARLKTMTRRLVRCPRKFRGVEDIGLEFRQRPGQDFYYDCVVVDGDGRELGQLPLPYDVGQTVAIAQSYGSLYEEGDEARKYLLADYMGTPGWRNKMLVRSDLMAHSIRITDLWFERLQDISEEDCLKEGVSRQEADPMAAFARLIDMISGKGTWDSNPWVVVYTFELVV